MRATEVFIKNFRGFGSRQILRSPSNRLALVGSNNAGKSTVLLALEWILGSTPPYQLAQRIERHDFHDTKLPIEIGATLGEITPEDKGQLMLLATNKQQRGALSKDDNPSISIVLQIPPFEPSGDESESNKATLDIKLWGWPVHRGQTSVRRRLFQYLRVDALRRVEAHLSASRWTPYGELMKSVLEGSTQFEDLKNLLTDVNLQVRDAFAAQKEAMLSGAQIASYVDDIDFQLKKENNPVELLRNLQVFVTEEGRRLNLERVGLGTQNAVVIGMLELALKARLGHGKLFAIEEPDAFLHPHGVRLLAHLIQKIDQEAHAQVVLSTHSPVLLATLTPGELARIEKKNGESRVFQSVGTLNDPTYARFVNQDNAEMFFADRVVLVEGPTERFLFPPLARIISPRGSSDLDRLRISIVQLEGKTSLLNFLRILDDFEIETRALLDKDFLGDPTCRRLIEYLQGVGKMVKDGTPQVLQADLRNHGIIVLPKGEIEDYVPIEDVVAVTGKSIDEVQKHLGQGKTSEAFKKIFGATKPLYAKQLAEYYLSNDVIAESLEAIIHEILT